MENIVILGSTGSIGTQALEIIKESNDFRVIGLSCGTNIELLEKQIDIFRPKYVSTLCACARIKNKYKDIVFFDGEEGLIKMVELKEADTILNSLVGSVGLVPTIKAIENHKKVLLSNKETLVIGGELVKKALKDYNGTLYPIDSEHSSLWELFDEYKKENIESITITASGGPFRDLDISMLDNVKIEDVLNHPNWKMGKKITVDSATMMNKGFEVIEAYYLFDMPIDKIKTIINYESLVHSIVELKDGRMIYGVDKASMYNPIKRALYYPLINYKKEEYDESCFHFKEIDKEKYPCLNLAYEAITLGGLNPTILNSANEASVKLFLEGKIKFNDIYKINKKYFDYYKTSEIVTLENILKYDKIVKDTILSLFKEKK